MGTWIMGHVPTDDSSPFDGIFRPIQETDRQRDALKQVTSHMVNATCSTASETATWMQEIRKSSRPVSKPLAGVQGKTQGSLPPSL